MISRWSVCPTCREPLVTSLLVRKCEWVCVHHDPPLFFPLFGPPTEHTPTDVEAAAMHDRWDKNKRIYDDSDAIKAMRAQGGVTPA
jgi:hypothetical protein